MCETSPICLHFNPKHAHLPDPLFHINKPPPHPPHTHTHKVHHQTTNQPPNPTNLLVVLLDQVGRHLPDRQGHQADAHEGEHDREAFPCLGGWGQVAEADGGERDDAEVGGLDGAPVLWTWEGERECVWRERVREIGRGDGGD